MNVLTIQNEALNLPAAEKAKLIDLLWDSMTESEIRERETVWAEESERRIDAYDAGLLKARDAADVFAELKSGLQK